jgi:hypothetical protein
MFAFTMAVSFFEHGLQDALLSYYAHQKNRKAIMIFNDNLPKLNELLLLPDLKQILGPDKLFLIRSYIGPLNSLNLRNVTLHGFVMENEFHPSYMSFLLLLMTSLSNHVSNLLKEPQDYLHYLDCSHPIHGDQFLIYSHEMDDNLITQHSIRHDLPVIIQIMHRSLFIIPQFLQSHWLPAINEYIHGQWYKFLVYIFPALEHCIRRIFVSTNDCADRLLTAERNSLYTTLDILLSTLPSTYLPEGNNRIFLEFDLPLINAIFIS